MRRMLIGSCAVIAISAAIWWSFRVDEPAMQPVPQTKTSAPITVSAFTLDFGLVPVDGEVLRRLVLRNNGTERMTAALSINGKGISIAGEHELTLEPGTPQRVAIKANPQGPGRLAGELTIAFGGDHEPLVVALAGEAGSKRTGRGGVARNRRSPASDPAGTERGEREQPATDSAIAMARPDGRGESVGRRSAGGGASQTTPGSATVTPASGATVAPIVSGGGAAKPGRTRATADLAPFDPATAVPIVAIAAPPLTVRPSTPISPEEAATATPLHPATPVDDAAEAEQELVEEFGDGDEDPFDPFADDDAGRDDDDGDDDGRGDRNKDPFTTPEFVIAGSSRVSLAGSSAGFYPQQIPVLGADLGGPVLLTSSIGFPMVSLAFGETMQFLPAGPVSGEFNAASNQVLLRVPVFAVDSDGHQALINLELTTGTAFGRTDEGIVVSATGFPRDPQSGMLKLVDIKQIPRGSSNSVEGHPVAVEIWAQLTFGTSIAGGIR